MSDSDQFSVARTEDRAEIQHRIHQFCRAVDRMELDELHEVFHPDAYDDHGVFKGTPAGFIEWAKKRHATIAFSSHHVSNIYIEFASKDEAFAETYLLIWQSVTPSSSIMAGPADATSYEMLSSNRYVDRFTRRDGRWRIQTRTVVPGSAMRLSDDAPPTLADGFVRYTRDEHDPAEQLRLGLGVKE
ncbi:nuclear transport factor 2 family protein [Streptomyces arenae]|uniref:nuclear transport factor 2 family protein n=1 Tax=Streptomyces arenae TaxID=29301 RepID=UPI002658D392|nr:nuclear transport factor 2 family protein [Streptomyces arenae]MCG7207373.1 nuclear transport factor 2 family protein [Streptomyces arenae]